MSARAQWLTLVAMTLANSMILVDQTGVPLAIPEAVDDLGSSLDTSQWILTANVLPLAGLMVLGGRLGDQLGLRRVFLAGAVVFVVSSALAGAAQLSFLIVRRDDQRRRLHVFSRRSRWTWALSGEGPGITRKPLGVTRGGAGNDAGDGRPEPA